MTSYLCRHNLIGVWNCGSMVLARFFFCIREMERMSNMCITKATSFDMSCHASPYFVFVRCQMLFIYRQGDEVHRRDSLIEWNAPARMECTHKHLFHSHSNANRIHFSIFHFSFIRLFVVWRCISVLHTNRFQYVFSLHEGTSISRNGNSQQPLKIERAEKPYEGEKNWA